jgi:flagellar basal body rod protein FlgG
MIRGLYTAASGMLASMRRMEFVTNNLANAQTTGFKQDRSALSTFDEMMILQDGSVTPPGQHGELGELGMGAVAEEPMIDFRRVPFRTPGAHGHGPGRPAFTVRTADGLRHPRRRLHPQCHGAARRLARATWCWASTAPDPGPAGHAGGAAGRHADGGGRGVRRLAIVEFGLDQPLRKVGSNQFVARNEG